MDLSASKQPVLMEGALSVDDRGQVSFVNDFHFEGVKRFYVVRNHQAGFVRAWHAHRREGKYITVVQGSAIIGAVEIDNWEKPSKENKVHRYVLSATKPSVLYIPPGFANGFRTLSANTILMFFSTSTLEDSKNDDIRFDARYWDVWNVAER